MRTSDIISCFASNPLILTEGAVGQRIEREYNFVPDKDIMYAAMIYDRESRMALENIYRQYLAVAQEFNLPILLMTNTRRANRERLLESKHKSRNVMYDYAVFLKDIASKYSCESYVGGMMGCKGDAYKGDEGLPLDEAVIFHTWQMEMFSKAPIDYLFAGIMPAKDEVLGMATVMQQSKKPYIISFMINRGGTLLDGTTIHDAISQIDGLSDQKPLCYITNCVHPSILKDALSKPFNNTEVVKNRFCGIQANAACVEPEKLDGSCELYTSSSVELVNEFKKLCNDFPMKILGGCCGTDYSHIREIAECFTR